MKKRHPIIAANRKMHAPPTGWDAPDSPFRMHPEVDVIVFPSSVDIDTCQRAEYSIGAQYGRAEKEGAFTGDISMSMLASHGCSFVLCGHSERRQHHHESNEAIASQVLAASDAGITPILCIGETADEREMGKAEEVVKTQLLTVIDALHSKPETLIVAYEPVWAIGNGKTASADEAQEMHAFIRSLIPADFRETLWIIYGGSVKPTNAAELIAQPDIDGFLVGASSLKIDEFQSIITAAL